MKKTLFILTIALMMFSCNKAWKCCGERTVSGLKSPDDQFNKTTIECNQINTNRKGINSHEEGGTYERDLVAYSDTVPYYFHEKIVTTCTKK